jgi:hypothetical protein
VDRTVGTIPDATTITTELPGHVLGAGPVGSPSKKTGTGSMGVPKTIAPITLPDPFTHSIIPLGKKAQPDDLEEFL